MGVKAIIWWQNLTASEWGELRDPDEGLIWLPWLEQRESRGHMQSMYLRRGRRAPEEVLEGVYSYTRRGLYVLLEV